MGLEVFTTRPILKPVAGLLAFDDRAPVPYDTQDALRRIIDVGDLSDSAVRLCSGDAGVTGRDQSHNGLGAGFAFFCGIRIGRRDVPVFRVVKQYSH